jgi:hypothetical protein
MLSAAVPMNSWVPSGSKNVTPSVEIDNVLSVSCGATIRRKSAAFVRPSSPSVIALKGAIVFDGAGLGVPLDSSRIPPLSVPSAWMVAATLVDDRVENDSSVSRVTLA